MIREINAQARERQEAWLETERPELTDALSRKLDRAFADLRRADREAYQQGEPEGTPYKGKISARQ